MKILPVNNYNLQPAKKQTFKQTPALLRNAAKLAFVPATIAIASCTSTLNASTLKFTPQSPIYEQCFKLNEQNYKLVYDGDDNEVAEIYFVPEQGTPLRLEHMTYHNFNDKTKNFVSVQVSKNGESTEEIILPEEIGQSLLDLYNGDSEFYAIPGFNTYTDINEH